MYIQRCEQKSRWVTAQKEDPYSNLSFARNGMGS